MKKIRVETGVRLNHLNKTGKKRLQILDDIEKTFIRERFATDFKYFNYDI